MPSGWAKVKKDMTRSQVLSLIGETGDVSSYTEKARDSRTYEINGKSYIIEVMYDTSDIDKENTALVKTVRIKAFNKGVKRLYRKESR